MSKSGRTVWYIGDMSMAEQIDRLPIPMQMQPAVLLKKFGKFGKEDGCFRYPSGVTVGTNGHIYVADNRLSRVFIFDPDGNYITYFVCAGAAALTTLPNGNIAVGCFTGTTWMAEQSGVRIYSPDGQIIRQIRTVQAATSIAVNAKKQLVVVDQFQLNVVTLDDQGNIINKYCEVGSNGDVRNAAAVAVNSANEVVITDDHHHCINIFETSSLCGVAVSKKKIGHKGKARSMTSDLALDQGQGCVADELRLHNPKGVCIDNHDNMYVADSKNGRIVVLSRDTHFLRSILVTNPKSIQKPFVPESLALTPTGEIVVTCVGDNFAEVRIYAI